MGLYIGDTQENRDRLTSMNIPFEETVYALQAEDVANVFESLHSPDLDLPEMRENEASGGSGFPVWDSLSDEQRTDHILAAEKACEYLPWTETIEEGFNLYIDSTTLLWEEN
tara:strand:+ start:389 stop:724 length:336 start_codon:yes stop_codon:yes gene_type:complete